MAKYLEKQEKRIRNEKKMLRRNFSKIRKIDKEEEKKQEKVISDRRQLRKEYLDSLKTNNITLINDAEQSMLGYEIGLKLKQEQDKEIEFE